MKKEFNGTHNMKEIKWIFKSRELEDLKQWTLKPKKEIINTPHFVQKFDLISVHEDYSDNK